jgi:hypothetical protein
MAAVKYLAFRDLRNTPGALWKKLRGDSTVALTANGVPRALVIGIENGDVEAAVRVVTRAKAQLALSRLRQRAAAAGLDRLAPETIEAEVRAVRQRRPR